MFENLNDSNVIKEEELENGDSYNDNYVNFNESKRKSKSGSGNESGNKNETVDAIYDDGADDGKDIYNSNPAVPKKLSGKDFLRYFKLPLIILAILITALLFIKYILSGKPEKVVKKVVKNNTVINDKKMFSPAVFNESGKNNSVEKNRLSSKSNKIRRKKFNVKFKKEADNLNRRIKFNSGVGNGNGYGGHDLNSRSGSAAQITKKTVVFIKASYGKYILNKERGLKTVKGQRKNGGFPQKTAYSEIAVPQGAVINAYTKYKIFSYNTSVPVIAVSVSGYYRGGKRVFEKGAEFFGTVSVKHSLNRLNINFNKIIEHSGKSLTIDAIAMMPDGSGGVKGDVHNHYAGNILTSIAQGIVGAASIFVGGGSSVNSSNPYTFQDQVRQNVAQNELNDAENGLNGYAQSNQNISITLPAGTPIKIIFLRPLYMNGI
jgi:hypothetical protein